MTFFTLVWICDETHPLVKLAQRVDWAGLEERFGSKYALVGRPGIRIRLMAGLTMLQSMHGLSEDEVVNRWPENPYWQYLCGETFFQHQKPMHRTDLGRWRKRIGAEGLEFLLSETIRIEVQTETVIGHQKSENRLDRNFLRGAFGDAANTPRFSVCEICGSWHQPACHPQEAEAGLDFGGAGIAEWAGYAENRPGATPESRPATKLPGAATRASSRLIFKSGLLHDRLFTGRDPAPACPGDRS